MTAVFLGLLWRSQRINLAFELFLLLLELFQEHRALLYLPLEDLDLLVYFLFFQHELLLPFVEELLRGLVLHQIIFVAVHLLFEPVSLKPLVLQLVCQLLPFLSLFFIVVLLCVTSSHYVLSGSESTSVSSPSPKRNSSTGLCSFARSPRFASWCSSDSRCRSSSC